MKMIEFLEQRKTSIYTQAEHLVSLEQFLFFLTEVKFSHSELETTIPQITNSIRLNCEDKFACIDFESICSDKNLSFRDNLIKSLKTHVGVEAIRAARDSFGAIYSFNKLKKGQSEEEKDKIKKNVQNITTKFFDIMNIVNQSSLPNINSFVSNGFFGKEIICSYHENLILLAMHNYSQFSLDEFKNLIDTQIPDGSINNSKFLNIFASILYDDNKADLVNTILKKVDIKTFALACLNQTNNHRNFYSGLKIFLDNQDEMLRTVDKDNIFNSFINNISMIGMLNNGYYHKMFNKEYKDKLVKFISIHPDINDFLFTLIVKNLRFKNLDFTAFINKPVINKGNLIVHILLKMNSDKNTNIGVLMNFLVPHEQISFANIGNSLSSITATNFRQILGTIEEIFSPQDILTMMNSSSTVFKMLEPIYRSKKLHNTMSQINKDNSVIVKKVKI